MLAGLEAIESESMSGVSAPPPSGDITLPAACHASVGT